MIDTYKSKMLNAYFDLFDFEEKPSSKKTILAIISTFLYGYEGYILFKTKKEFHLWRKKHRFKMWYDKASGVRVYNKNYYENEELGLSLTLTEVNFYPDSKH